MKYNLSCRQPTRKVTGGPIPREMQMVQLTLKDSGAMVGNFKTFNGKLVADAVHFGNDHSVVARDGRSVGLGCPMFRVSFSSVRLTAKITPVWRSSQMPDASESTWTFYVPVSDFSLNEDWQASDLSQLENLQEHQQG